MRGNRVSVVCSLACMGSIPAHAGEPLRSCDAAPPRWVYPRACGGTCFTPSLRLVSAGLSPRMRGNRRVPGADSPLAGSIPAHAGEPQCVSRLPSWARVYPRACGGTSRVPAPRPVLTGLSPRMRGNHAVKATAPVLARSIPAHAGEPGHMSRPDHAPWVYPRACGGTADASRAAIPRGGLSPRMRGNRCGRP